MADCPIFISPVTGIVNSGIEKMQGYAQTSFNYAISLVDKLEALNLTPIDVNVNFDPGVSLIGFVAPPVPATPSTTYDTSDFHDPGDVPASGLTSTINFAPVPTFNGHVPSPIGKYQPQPLSATNPGIGPFTPSPLNAVSAPVLDEVVEPTLRVVTLPPPPVLNIPKFTASAPLVDFLPPRADIGYAPVTFTDALLDSVKAKLTDMLGNSLGLPPAVEAALFARERGRQTQIAQKAILEAVEDTANKGWFVPHGGTAQRIAQARQNAANAAATASSDIYVNNQKELLLSVRKAVEEGVALTATLYDGWVKTEDLKLKSATLTLQVATEIFNGNVSLFNARNQAFGIAAQVFRDLIAAENLKLEQDRELLERAKITEELNKDDIALLAARIAARTQRVDLYRAQLLANEDIIKQDNLRLEGDRILLQEFDTEVTAWAKQWDVVEKQYEVDVSNGRVYGTLSEAFASQVRAVSDGNKNLIDQAGLTLRSQELQIQGWNAKLQRLLADMQNARNRLDAIVQVFDGQARIYAASGEVAKSQSDANARAVQIIVETLRAQADIAIKNLELKVTQAIQVNGQILERVKAGAQTTASLASGAMAAVHVAASAEDQNSTRMSSDCGIQTTLYGTA